MDGRTTLLSLLALAVALAGCASPGADTTVSTPTPTPPTATPTATTPAAQTPTPEVPDAEGPPAMMECHGDYVTQEQAGERLGMPELSFTVKEPDDEDPCYAFIGPATTQSGWNVFTVSHPGTQFHIMPMYYIGDHQLPEFIAAMMAAEAEGGAEPDWAVPAGAVGGLTAGQEGSVALDLDVGTYVYFCPIDGHMMQGMMGTLVVTPAEEEAAPPAADVTVELVDYNFTIPAVSDHVRVMKVFNNGSEPHEAPLFKLEGGATAMEFLQAVEDPNATGPPPGSLVGGVNVIAPGQTAYLLLDLVDGERYAMACFVSSDGHDHAAHLELGMIAEFTIGEEHAEDAHA